MPNPKRNPRGRHAAGKPQTPRDEPWTRTSDRGTWRAYRRGWVLTVTRLAVERWQAVAEREDTTGRSPVIATRLAAQAWAERQTGGTQ